MSYQPFQSEHAFWQTVDFSSADLSPRIFESGYNMGHLASGRISQRSVVRPSCVHPVQSNLIRRTRWCCQFFEIPPPSPVVTQCPESDEKREKWSLGSRFFWDRKKHPTELLFGKLINRQRSKKVKNFENDVSRAKNLKIRGKTRKREQSRIKFLENAFSSTFSANFVKRTWNSNSPHRPWLFWAKKVFSIFSKFSPRY